MDNLKRIALVCFASVVALYCCSCNDNVQSTSLSAPSTTQTREAYVPPTQTDETQKTTQPTSFVTDADVAELIFSIASDNFQGTILIGQSGQRLFEASFGYADVEKGVPLSESSVYEIGYLTAQITQKAFLLMIEEEGLDIDTMIVDYIPEYQYSDQISFRHLLEMSSGIPDYLEYTIADEGYSRSVLRRGVTSQESLDAINDFTLIDSAFESVLESIELIPLLFEPGENIAYSSSNYVFMAEIIARVSGIPYVHYLQRNILTPMQLDTASFTDTSHTASGYMLSDQMQIVVPGSRLLSEAGLRMSASDLYSWTHEQISDFLISEEDDLPSMMVMFTPLPRSVYMAQSAIGGYYCLQVVIPEIDLVIIILSNQNRIDHPAEELMDSIVDYYAELYDLYEDN